MEIKAISAINGSMNTSLSSVQPPQSAFVDWLSNEVSTAGKNIASAEKAALQLASGETENLHQVMLAISRAQTSMELVVEVRNRLVESAQELMRMSV